MSEKEYFNVADIFGENVFNDAVMQERLPKKIYKKHHEVIEEGKELFLSPGHSTDIPLKAVHSLQNPYKDNLKIIEVQKGDPLIEEDIIRYEDMYGRV